MKAAVLERIGQPLSIRELLVDSNIEDHQVFIRVLVSGICGAQLQEIDGKKGDPEHCPHLLGHEGCGVVVAIGSGVTKVKGGDKVVIHWRKGIGGEGKFPRFISNNGDVKAGHCTTFSEFTIVSENRITKIPDDVPHDFAALLGCCLSTAISIIENEAKPKFGDSVLIIGCGGLGLALILAAEMRKNCKIYAIDLAKGKKKLVESLGARFTDRYDKRGWLPPFEIIIDTVGDCIAEVSWLRLGGKYISLQAGGSSGGGFNPDRDIPRYVDMWRGGVLDDYKKLITHRIPLNEINEGIKLMRDGKAGRVLIDMQ